MGNLKIMVKKQGKKRCRTSVDDGVVIGKLLFLSFLWCSSAPVSVVRLRYIVSVFVELLLYKKTE